MNRDQAREYFQGTALTYSDLSVIDINLLISILEREFKNRLADGDDHDKEMAMKVSHVKKKDIQLNRNQSLKSAEIKVDSSYFSDREAITFNENGFIGFGGELDQRNVQPILKAFKDWCDHMLQLNTMTV